MTEYERKHIKHRTKVLQSIQNKQVIYINKHINKQLTQSSYYA